MKALIIAFFASLLLFGCGSSDLDDPKTLDDIIAKAIDEDKLQERGKVGEELCYIPNAQTPYSGWAKSIYENGQVKQLRQLKDGKPEGLQTLWYQNGQKKEEANFKDGKLDGLGSSDLDDPKTLDDIIAEAIDEDKLQKRGKEGEELCYSPNAQTPYSGWAKSIYENGQVKQLRQLKDGKLEGLQTFWYEHGQKKEEANFKDGIEDGLSTEWYDNGQKKEEANFKDGKLDGLVTWWYQNGQKSQEQNWKDDKKNGLEIEWDQNGQKEEEENWKDGKKDGLSTEWYDNGQKASEVIFKDDKAVSATMWKPNGEKCPITNFVGGNGVVVEYNEKSGAVRRRWTFKNGEPVVD